METSLDTAPVKKSPKLAAPHPLIYAKMPAVMAELDAISKARKNTQQGYSFRGIDDCLNALHGPLAKHGVFFTAAVRDVQQREYATKTGTAMLHVTLVVAYTFFAADGSSVTYEAVGEASDSGDKAAGKAQAYALKLVLLQAFCIPTEEQKDTEYYSPDRAAALAVAPAVPLAVMLADYPLKTAIRDLLRHESVSVEGMKKAHDELPTMSRARAEKVLANLKAHIAQHEGIGSPHDAN